MGLEVFLEDPDFQMEGTGARYLKSGVGELSIVRREKQFEGKPRQMRAVFATLNCPSRRGGRQVGPAR